MKHSYILVTPENLKNLESEVLPAALEYNFRAVKTLLLVLSAAIEQGVPLSPKLAKYLAHALRDISYGGDLSSAFHIKRKRGGRDVSRSVEIAAIRALKVKQVLSNEPNLSVEAAVAKVAATENAPEDSVWAAWKRHKTSIELRPGGAIINWGDNLPL